MPPPFRPHQRHRTLAGHCVTKLAIDHFGRVYNEIYGLQTVSLRFTEVYGPGNRMPQILRDIVKTVLRGERLFMENGSDHLFHFIHIEDVARAAILAATAETMKGARCSTSSVTEPGHLRSRRICCESSCQTPRFRSAQAIAILTSKALGTSPPRSANSATPRNTPSRTASPATSSG
ncbi:NAD-dependent epimerase/dehydratase family protein [Mesorhizobium sp. B2-3-13]|nr:NAD-dependent epimerase/dehydratase family protein [Mesorhizobium sp. B2-5-13]TPK54791.1 NAD-dependent epimerase/dehydratase family protein [Mesorhizobium sp. B2-5-5]TPL90085.1 NAD-dependent epimerase/dehydratase family protein [Mesorhizobium sp. B2-3-13]